MAKLESKVGYLGAFKRQDRASRKAWARYGGKMACVTDIVRGTLCLRAGL